jgi:lipopolysaccharide export system permease protein
MEKMDAFMDSKVSLSVIVRYYMVYLPDILRILAPVSILISCLFTIGRLSNNNEITAMKSGGMGLLRLLFPIAIVGILLCVAQYFFNGWVVPAANEEKEHINQFELGRSSSNEPVSNLAFRDAPERNVLIQYYNSAENKGYFAIIEEYIPNTINTASPTLSKHIEANSIVWDEKQNDWVLHKAMVRTVVDKEHITTNLYNEMPYHLNITQKQMAKINRKTTMLNFDEMREYISLLKQGGKDVRNMEIDLHSSQALPLANFIVILFAVSFASVKKRNGMAVQVAAAMVIAFTYLIFFQVSKPIGIALNMPAVLIGWFANIIFFVCGIISVIKARM